MDHFQRPHTHLNQNMKNRWKTILKQLRGTEKSATNNLRQNRCKKIDEIGILCEDKPSDHCEQKATTLHCLSIGTEGRRIFKSKHPLFQIEKEPLKELWRVMQDSFIETRNIFYDRFVFLSSEQQKEESVESF